MGSYSTLSTKEAHIFRKLLEKDFLNALYCYQCTKIHWLSHGLEILKIYSGYFQRHHHTDGDSRGGKIHSNQERTFLF